MNQEIFWVLFSKKLSGEASDAEKADFQNHINEHPEWQYAIQSLEDLWKHDPPKDIMQDEDAYMLHMHRMKEMNISLEEDSAKTNTVSIGIKKIKKWYWAAAAILVVTTGLFLFRKSTIQPEEKEHPAGYANEVSSQPGSKTKIKLPDGSIVWLNAGSKLTYTKEFGKKVREVNLTGEAFFDVTKINEKPFIIHTSSINIRVLGTSFNVKAYPDDKLTETSLIRGSIEVTIKNRPNDKIILSPSEKLVVENNMIIQKEKSSQTINADYVVAQPSISPLVIIDKLKYSPADSSVAETQWINNKLIFRDESFADLAVRMERWYNVSIEIKDPLIRQARLNGIFQTETISQALQALKESIPFRFEKNGNKIFIHP
ncbi:MAG: FecR family protein [Chitinophagaceae bacterium]